jgi:hypothetical protein
MRWFAWVGVILTGVIVVSGLMAAIDNGRDHTGETVRSAQWADDVCGTVGAWEGQLKAIREDLRHNNWASRRSDGGTGDSNEQIVTVRSATNRAIRATHDTLHEGLKRAGIPDSGQGAAASAIMLNWAGATERRLRVAKALIKERPTSVAEGFAALIPPYAALASSAVNGRAAFAKVAALDSELGDAFDRSGNCRRLMKRDA